METEKEFYRKIWDLKFGFHPHTWKQVVEIIKYPYNANSLQKKFSRIAKKLGKPVKPEKKGLLSEDDEETFSEEELEYLEIDRTKYGTIPPTFYKSPLSHDDWVDKYIPYDYSSDDPTVIEQLKREWRTHYLTKLSELIWESIELLALLPRGYGKTERILALFIRWILEVREPLYIVAPSEPHMKKLLKRMEAIMRSPRIRRDYGDIAAKFLYGKSEMSIIYHADMRYRRFDNPVTIVTWYNAKEGLHPAWIHFEDVMQKLFKDRSANDDIKFKYSKTFNNMRTVRNGKLTKMTFTGTRYDVKDFYHFVMTKFQIPVYHVRALDENDNMTKCPNHTKETLLKMREIAPIAFETNMNNNPIPSSGNYFKREAWDNALFDDDTRESLFAGNIGIFAACDPNLGITDESDNTAFIVYALKNNTLWAIDGFTGKISLPEIRKYVQMYNEIYGVLIFDMETVFALGVALTGELQNIGNIAPFHDNSTDAKYIRISAMKALFANGRIRIWKGLPNYNQLLEEYLLYDQEPSTEGKKDDTLDALSMAVKRWSSYLSANTPDFNKLLVIGQKNRYNYYSR